MTEPIEPLISKYVQGNLSAEEQKIFDQKFEADPIFSGKVLEAMGQRLGPGPQAFLDRVGQTAKPAVEEAWRRKWVTTAKTMGNGFATAWSSALPVAVLLAALLGLVCAAKFMVSRTQDRRESVWTVAPAVAPIQVTTDLQPSHDEAERGQPTTLKVSGKSKHPSGDVIQTAQTLEGYAVRFQNLPVSVKTTIGIFDLKGVCVRNLYEGPWAKGQKLDWDGRDNAGKNVALGVYKASVQCPEGVFVSRFVVK
jgi:hypothetical protein